MSDFLGRLVLRAQRPAAAPTAAGTATENLGGDAVAASVPPQAVLTGEALPPRPVGIHVPDSAAEPAGGRRPEAIAPAWQPPRSAENVAAAPASPEDFKTAQPTAEIAHRLPAESADNAPEPPASQPAQPTAPADRLRSFIEHLVVEHAAAQTPDTAVESVFNHVPVAKDDAFAAAPPGSDAARISIGRIDIVVAPPPAKLPPRPRASGPPRNQGFAGYGRVRRGLDR